MPKAYQKKSNSLPPRLRSSLSACSGCSTACVQKKSCLEKRLEENYSVKSSLAHQVWKCRATCTSMARAARSWRRCSSTWSSLERRLARATNPAWLHTPNWKEVKNRSKTESVISDMTTMLGDARLEMKDVTATSDYVCTWVVKRRSRSKLILALASEYQSLRTFFDTSSIDQLKSRLLFAVSICFFSTWHPATMVARAATAWSPSCDPADSWRAIAFRWIFIILFWFFYLIHLFHFCRSPSCDHAENWKAIVCRWKLERHHIMWPKTVISLIPKGIVTL